MSGLCIAVILILAGFTLHGYLKGMVKVLFSLVSVVLTIVLVSWLTPYVAEFLQTKTPVYEIVQEKAVEAVRLKTEEEVKQETGAQKAEEETEGRTAEEQKQDQEQEQQNQKQEQQNQKQEQQNQKQEQQNQKPGQQNLKQEQQDLKQEGISIAGIEIPKEWQELLQGKAGETAGNILEQSGVYEKVGDYVARIVVNGIACILTLILVIIILRILVNMLDIVARLPVLKTMNRLGGVIAGAAEGVIVVWIIFFIITLCKTSAFGQQMLSEIDQSIFLKFLYENNGIQYAMLHFFR